MPTPRYVLEARGKAEELRNAYDLGLDSIGNLYHFIEESLGILVVSRPMGSEGIDGIFAKRGDSRLIVVNSDKQVTRQRFTTAHELGHFFFDNISGTGIKIDQNIYEGNSIPEKRANAFAAHFLMPEAGVKRVLNTRRASKKISPYDVIHLKYHFGVSYKAALYHLENLGFIDSKTRIDWFNLQPTKLALELGLESSEYVEDRIRPRLPADYVSRAINAYKDARISLRRLAELLEEDPYDLEVRLKELGIFPKEPDIDKDWDTI